MTRLETQNPGEDEIDAQQVRDAMVPPLMTERERAELYASLMHRAEGRRWRRGHAYGFGAFAVAALAFMAITLGRWSSVTDQPERPGLAERDAASVELEVFAWEDVADYEADELPEDYLALADVLFAEGL